jgi:hypothetical protein
MPRVVEDTLVVNLSDFHSGGSTALFLPKFWQGVHTNHTPTKLQKQMWRHFDKCAAKIAEMREGKRLVVVHNGDAIDGWHHSTLEVVTRSENEQIEIHCDIMDLFLIRIGFNKEKGDKLFYTLGTECHTNDGENQIGEDLGAEMNGDLYVFNNLKININGREISYLHHGPTAGRGPNIGNAHRNWLRDKFFLSQRMNEKQTDMFVTSHVHVGNYGTFVGREDNTWHTVRGIITPSWQIPTRYGKRASKGDPSDIGLFTFVVTASGDILDPVPMIKSFIIDKPIML